jgi:hypothetical protein
MTEIMGRLNCGCGTTALGVEEMTLPENYDISWRRNDSRPTQSHETELLW